MFKCHLSGLAKEVLAVGVHIGWKLHIPQLSGGVFFALSAEEEHTPETITHLCAISNRIWVMADLKSSAPIAAETY